MAPSYLNPRQRRSLALLRGAFSSGVGEKKTKVNRQNRSETQQPHTHKKNPTHRKQTQHARSGAAEPAWAHAIGGLRLGRSWQTKQNLVKKPKRNDAV